MSFHQIDNSVENVFNAFVYREAVFDPHFHRGFELVYAMLGSLSATVDCKELKAVEGEALLIPPYVLHSLDMNENSLVFVMVFAGSYAGSLEQKLSGKIPAEPKLALSSPTRDFLCEKMIPHAIYEAYRAAASTEEKLAIFSTYHTAIPMPPSFRLKACIYAVADEFFAATEFVPRPKGNKPVFEMLDYIERNYTSDIDLHTMAAELGYDYRYLSRVFKRVLGISFRTLLNRHRCDKAQILLDTTDESLSSIAMNSGFQSIRTFNRVFKEMTGVAPSEYR